MLDVANLARKQMSKFPKMIYNSLKFISKKM